MHTFQYHKNGQWVSIAREYTRAQAMAGLRLYSGRARVLDEAGNVIACRIV